MNATPDPGDTRTLEILAIVQNSEQLSQRYLARQLGVALGLANSYLKRCVKKGWVKVQQAPANRYLYYLTPTGFAEKSRLTTQYLSYSSSVRLIYEFMRQSPALARVTEQFTLVPI